MQTLSDLISSCHDSLDDSINYIAKLQDAGYRNVNALAKAGGAKRLEDACNLLPGDADVIWSAAQASEGEALQELPGPSATSLFISKGFT